MISIEDALNRSLSLVDVRPEGKGSSRILAPPSAARPNPMRSPRGAPLIAGARVPPAAHAG